MRPRQIAPVALVLLVTIAGSVGAHLLAEREARRDSERRVDVAAAQVRDRVREAVSLTESLQRFMQDSSGAGVTAAQFVSNALNWLTPAGFPVAAWVERVPESRRASYERQLGQPIVAPDPSRLVVPPGTRSSYLPATLVSGFAPLDAAGVDLSGAPGMAAALARATRTGGVAATALARTTGTTGLFLVAAAPNLVLGVLDRGYVVVFVSNAALGAATDPPTAKILALSTSAHAGEPGNTATQTFAAAGQRFDVFLPREPVNGAAAVLPWLILAGGLVLAALAVALGINGARRIRAQEELDRIFTLSSDLIAVADFNGFFTRVNPAAEQILGYTKEELLARPYLDFVHPDDRDKTAAEASAVSRGKTTLSFEDRYVRKDGSVRVLQWTSTPIVEKRVMYSVARDVTEPRQAEAERERLADEQAALGRVATLVAQGVSPAEIFSAVSNEVGRLFGTDMAAVGRFDPEGPAYVVAGLTKSFEEVTVGSRWELDDLITVARVYRSGRSARHDRIDWSRVHPPIGDVARSVSAVSSPITVEGRIWGAITVSAREQLPADVEERLEKFTGLVATAIANAESRGAIGQLAEEQVALRRVAELVAAGTAPAEIFAAIAREIGQLLGTDEMRMMRYESDREAVVVGAAGSQTDVFPAGSRWPLGPESVLSRVFRTGQPARISDYRTGSGRIAETVRSMSIRAAVGTPILVQGQLWGTMLTGTFSDDPLPPDTESRLSQFTELMATAIANAEARGEVEQLVDEQAALRRVATLVAEGASPAAVFDAVAAEIERLFLADQVVVSRYEPGAEVTVLAHRGSSAHAFPPGVRISHEGDSVESVVWRTERSARLGNYEQARGAMAALARAAGVRVAVGAPIVVDGRLWGVISTGWNGDESSPADTEERMVQFAQLLDTAIANADSRDQLTASRARLLVAGDEARRRIVRDLHDGAQQRLVHTILTLKFARRALRANDGRAESLMDEALQHAERGNAELRELAHGLLPGALTHGGLRGGIGTIVSRFDLPVRVDVPAERFPAEIEASAYFIVAEALTNIMKHARAGAAEVKVSAHDGALHVDVCDDGIGGADPHGHGLVGLSDRVATLGGTLSIESPATGGTVVSVTLPLPAG